MSSETVLLTRAGYEVPWGFRLQGGVDQNKPLTVQRVMAGSVAATRLSVGDVLLSIGDTDTSSLSGAAAMDLIKASGNSLQFLISRDGISAGTIPAQSVSTPETQFSNGFASPPGVRYHTSEIISNEDSRKSASPRINIHTASRPPPNAPRPIVNQPVSIISRPRPDASFSPPRLAHVSSSSRPAQAFSPPRSFQSFSPHQSSSPLVNNDEFGRPSPPPPKIHRSQLQSRASPLSQSPLLSQPSQQSPSVPAAGVSDLRSQKPFTYVPDFVNIPQQSNHLRQQRQSPQPVPRQTTSDTLENNFRLNNKEAAAAERRRMRRRGLQQDSSIDSLTGPDTNNFSVGSNPEPEFDEAAYLSGRISILGGPPRALPVMAPAYTNVRSEPQEEEVEKEKPFDERAYLAGRIPLVQGGPIDPSTFNVPEKRPVRKHPKDHESKPKLTTPFNEQAYLSGQISILGDPNHKAALPPRPKPAVVKASWMKSDQELLSEDEFTEDSFLKGRISVVRSAIDRPVHAKGRETTRPFNQGPQTRAAWERDSSYDDNSVGSDVEFDEQAFLSGGRPRADLPSREQYIEGEGQSAPLKSIRYLRRSASNDKCLNSGDEACVGITSFSEDEAGSDYDKTYKDFVYVGKKIPSKTFMRLQKTMARKSATDRNKIVPFDSIERLKEKSLQGMDVDVSMEKLNIEKHDPAAYMELLKKSVQENDLKIEIENESTDF